MSILQTIDLEETNSVVIRLEVLVEDSALEGNASCHDDDIDAEVEADVRAEWDHNNFCWCTLRVVAELANSPEIYGDDFLGCVSILEKYLSPGETLEGGAKQMVADYDMISNAKAALDRAVAGVETSIDEFKRGR